MKGCRSSFISALATALLAGGCAHATHAAAPAVALPAPTYPDLGAVMERFYQFVEGGHWRFAYAMLAPAYRARTSEAKLVARYSRYVSFDVTVRQQSDTSVVSSIAGVARDGGRSLHEETVTLAWDGADWKITGLRWTTAH